MYLSTVSFEHHRVLLGGRRASCIFSQFSFWREHTLGLACLIIGTRLHSARFGSALPNAAAIRHPARVRSAHPAPTVHAPPRFAFFSRRFLLRCSRRPSPAGFDGGGGLCEPPLTSRLPGGLPEPRRSLTARLPRHPAPLRPPAPSRVSEFGSATATKHGV